MRVQASVALGSEAMCVKRLTPTLRGVIVDQR